MKFRILFLFSLMLTVFGSVSALAQKNNQTHRDVNVQEANKIINAGNVLVLDVRTKGEYNQGHLNNAVNINLYDPKFNELINKLDKTKPVVVYCAVGGRSAEAKEALIAAGFSSVINMTGGYEAWEENKLPVTK